MRSVDPRTPARALPRRAALAAAAVLLAGVVACSKPPALPELFPVPSLSLVSHKGEAVMLEDFRGKVAVYDFIFTRCTGPCPMMTSAMKRVASRFDSDDAVRFLSISVDPDYDQPDVLTQFASTFGVENDRRWIFLTGDRDAIYRASVDGFKLAAFEGSGEEGTIIHSTRFVLADRRGMIRGYYDPLSPEGEKELVRDIRRLMEEK